MRKTVLLAGAISVLLSVSAFARVPTSEVANYKLDKRGDRSSRIIKSGVLKLTGGEHTPKQGTQGTYKVALEYDLKVILIGSMKDKKIFQAPAEFFTPEYMQRLRKEKQIDAGAFKLKHLAIEDVETHAGVRYASCDKVLAYDVKMDQTPAFDSLINETFAALYLVQHPEEPKFDYAMAEDFKLLMYISQEIPVLGAAKIDVSAVVRGMNVKAGFDYVR